MEAIRVPPAATSTEEACTGCSIKKINRGYRLKEKKELEPPVQTKLYSIKAVSFLLRRPVQTGIPNAWLLKKSVVKPCFPSPPRQKKPNQIV